MLICPNLLSSISLSIAFLVYGPPNVGFLERLGGAGGITTKSSIFLPILTNEELKLYTKEKEYFITSYLRTITFVPFEIVKINGQGDDNYPSQLTLTWAFACGSELAEINVPLRWDGKTFSTSIGQAALGMAIFRSKVVILGTNDQLVQFSFTLPVTDELIGWHKFTLKDNKGNVLRGTQGVDLKTKVK